MAEANPGPSSSRGRGTSSKFFNDFVNDYLSKHHDAWCLVTLKEDDGRRFLLFNDVHKTSLIYCEYKQANGRVLNRNPKKRKDNFKNTIALSEKDGYLKKIGFGTEYEKEYLKYEIRNEQMWQSLLRNYSFPRNSHTTRENFSASEDGLSSDTSGLVTAQSDDCVGNETRENFSASRDGASSDTSGIVTTQSDDCVGNETRENFSARQDGPFSDTSGIVTTQSDDCVGNERKFRESLQWPREASSDTGDVSLSDDHLVDEPYFSLGETDKVEASFNTGISDDLPKEFLFGELALNDELDQYLPQKKVVNQMCPQKLKITPNFSYIEGGSTFSVHAALELQSGIYHVSFGPYGICKASGDGTKCLQGMDEIPKAQRSGTHSVTVQVWDENMRDIGNFPFTYKDITADAGMQELASEAPTSSGQWSPRNEADRATKTFSGESVDQEVRNKKMKSCPIDMPMLMYFCDEMAKRGDEDFFRALIGLGILADVLANPNEYFNSFAVTAREHGHGELAELIAMSSREQSYDSWMEKLTLGTLVDAVRTERSLANLVNSPDNDSDSCSSCYDGDCDSEDDAFCSDVGSDGDDDDDDDEDDDDDDDGPCSRIIPQEETAKETEATKSFSSKEEVNHVAVKREITELWIKSEQHPTTSGYKKSSTFDAITELNDTYEQEQKTDLPSWEISRTRSRLVVLVNVLGGGHFVVVKTLKVLLLLAMEFCPGGNIKELLSNSKINDEYKNIYCKFTERQLINFAAEIARGMQFLFENKIVHRDIASRDVLLDVQLVPKIADFGLARKIDDSAHYIVNKNPLLPVKWMSIESLAEGVFTAASDTWSNGILLSEIFTLGRLRRENELVDLLVENVRLRHENERLVEKEKFTFGISGRTFFSSFVSDAIRRWWNTNEQEAEPKAFKRLYDVEQVLSEIAVFNLHSFSRGAVMLRNYREAVVQFVTEQLERENEPALLRTIEWLRSAKELRERVIEVEQVSSKIAGFNSDSFSYVEWLHENGVSSHSVLGIQAISFESQRQIERKKNERLRLEKFGSVNVLGQYKSRGGRWKVMLMSVGSGCGQSLWQEYLKSMGKANSNSLTHCIEGFPDPCLDTSIYSKKCFSKVVKLIRVDRCNESRNSSQMNEQIEQFVDINRDPVDELQSIGAKDVESIAFVLVIIGDELVAIKKIYVQ